VKKMGNLFKNLGFKKGSSQTVQRAFFKHLVRVAESSSHQNPSLFLEQKPKLEPVNENLKQMSFDPEVLKAGNE